MSDFDSNNYFCWQSDRVTEAEIEAEDEEIENPHFDDIQNTNYLYGKNRFEWLNDPTVPNIPEHSNITSVSSAPALKKEVRIFLK